MQEAKREKRESRLREILHVLKENKILQGVTPEKLRIMLEELGPTYVKLGQIMSLHSDILPEEYCTELMRLNSSVKPMEFHEVQEVLEDAYQCDWREIFRSLDPKPLGSASIAQVHRARLQSGEEVIVKVQRKGIYDVMSRDIRLLKRAVRFLPSVGGLKNVVDLRMVLDELWTVSQEEMDFLKEASNMEEFQRNNRDLKYVKVPKLYRRFTTSRVLVMEYIDGIPINQVERLKELGYDPDEIGSKFVNNFIRQVMTDGFFHADPHPGNVRIQDGKIVWIDMGMMGRLGERDRRLMARGVTAIANRDVSSVMQAVKELGDLQGPVDNTKLYQDLKEFLALYADQGMGGVDIARAFHDLLEIMKRNRIKAPHGLTMLMRGLTHIEGVLSEISPDINMMQIASVRIQEELLHNIDFREEVRRGGRHLYRAVRNSIEIPTLTTGVLKEFLNGQSRLNLDLQIPRDTAWLLRKLVRNLVIGMWVLALLIASSIICTTNMTPKVFGIPLLGFLGFMAALGICIFVLIRHIITKNS